MRIWSIHPKYLDAKGLVALWRETLLAKNVLENKTKGYKNHPQLIRFKNTNKPLDSINQYLTEVYKEAKRRNYNFNKEKIDWNFTPTKINVNDKQLDYEFQHLLTKLEKRDPKKYIQILNTKPIEHAEIFNVVEGEIEQWEKQDGIKTQR